MRTLIFPTQTGQGHNYASLAIKEYLDAQGAETLILDVLDSGKKDKSKPVSHIYDGLVNHVPVLFGGLYHLAELISSSKHHSPIYFLNTLYAKSLYERIQTLDPQVIICPHMFSAHAITRLIEKFGLKIPTVGVITDYTCSPFWEETRLDYYTVANAEVAAECASKGMDAAKLLAFGIPVSQCFKTKLSPAEARQAFGIQREKVFLVMGGSMGYGKLLEITQGLTARRPDVQVVTVCGTNDQAFERISKETTALTLQYVDNISLLMDAADVLITKPGGLTTTEAMTKRIPLVISLPIPGGEERNSSFIARMGMAVSTKTVAATVDAACALINNPEDCQRMIDAQKRCCNINSAEDIGNFILGLARRG